MKQQHRAGLSLMLLVIMFGVIVPEAINPIADFIMFVIGILLFLIGD